MEGYVWSQTGFEKPLQVREGERVPITMQNTSMMAHPMRLHGHRFQVIGIEGVQLARAVRDGPGFAGQLGDGRVRRR